MRWLCAGALSEAVAVVANPADSVVMLPRRRRCVRSRAGREHVGDGSAAEDGGTHGLDSHRRGEEPLARAEDDLGRGTDEMRPGVAHCVEDPVGAVRRASRGDPVAIAVGWRDVTVERDGHIQNERGPASRTPRAKPWRVWHACSVDGLNSGDDGGAGRRWARCERPEPVVAFHLITAKPAYARTDPGIRVLQRTTGDDRRGEQGSAREGRCDLPGARRDQ